jgi:hypothetical protein
MVLGSDELERLADDAYRERRMAGTVYCGNCGYNLRTLFYVYRCPECGQEYNARPLVMRGIFLPQNVSPPFVEMFAVVLYGPIAFVLIDGATQPFEPAKFVMGLGAAILAVVYLWLAYGRWVRVLKARIIARRIAQAERE